MIKNICHLIASREHGGLEKHVADLSRWQARNTNAQVSVIAHPRYLPTLDEKVQFIPLNTDRSRHHPNLVWRLANQIRKGQYQIAHGHGSKSAQLLAAVKPYTEALQVITRHNVRHPRDKLASTFDARIAISEGAIANSRLEWHIIPNGVERQSPAANSPLLPEIIQQRPLLLAASRLIKARGIDRLIDAMALLPDTYLMILGDGPEKEALEAQCRNRGLEKRIVFFSADNTLANFLEVADLLVIPARSDGTPYTLIEALLNRCPVVSTPTGNALDYLPEAYLFSDLTHTHIAEKIQWALDQPKEDFATRFEHARQELTLDSMARATWQVYSRLIA
ncbi:glycosyltransferase family 4 protein [Microbulbifer aggregans]|uniref:glycosyltransferase family 4 protein n=1 Tax=Microbulbifer aggregans TaxID=1769779 RepID=UPI001CFF3A8B|nr:glycosyltransferase family 4 protein [Microbulbifer aggregans]